MKNYQFESILDWLTFVAVGIAVIIMLLWLGMFN